MPIEKGTTIVVKPGDPSYEASRLKGFRDRRVVARDYEIRDGILGSARHSPAYGWWRDYYPAAEKNIPIELAKIPEESEIALLRFARKYGLLGFTNLLPFSLASLHGGKLITKQELMSSQGFHNELPEKERLRLARDFARGERQGLEKLSQQCGLPDKNTWKAWVENGGGDPLPWVWAHVRTIKFCSELALRLAWEDEEEMVYFLRQYQPKDSKVRRRTTVSVWGSSEYPTSSTGWSVELEGALQHQIIRHRWIFPAGCTALEFAEHLYCELISGNIGGIHPAMQPEGNRKRIYFQSRSLIEMAYWHLGNLDQDGMLKRCKREGCGGFFIQTHGGTEFCPEPKTPKGESHCAVLHRGKPAKNKYREKLRRKRKPKR